MNTVDRLMLWACMMLLYGICMNSCSTQKVEVVSPQKFSCECEK